MTKRLDQGPGEDKYGLLWTMNYAKLVYKRKMGNVELDINITGPL